MLIEADTRAKGGGESSPSWVAVFQWTLEDLRVHYSEAPNAY